MSAPAVIEVGPLPPAPLDAAARFHAEIVPAIREEFAREEGCALAIVFAPADHSHRGWRLAAIQELAREVTPGRVNAVVGRSEAQVRAAIAFLADAPGVTGQLLEVEDGNPPAKG